MATAGASPSSRARVKNPRRAPLRRQGERLPVAVAEHDAQLPDQEPQRHRPCAQGHAGRGHAGERHPFVRELWGRYWVFAHNGDLENYASAPARQLSPVGDTDSELAFCWLMQELAKSHAGVPSVAELTLTLRNWCRRSHAMAPSTSCCPTARRCGPMPARTCTTWCASTRSTEVHLQRRGRERELSEHTRASDRVAVVVTAPLTTDEVWTPFSGPGELRVFVKGGRCIRLSELLH
jgi:predicted glutamine amidotransferase